MQKKMCSILAKYMVVRCVVIILNGWVHSQPRLDGVMVGEMIGQRHDLSASAWS